jgi:hypothetical protein
MRSLAAMIVANPLQAIAIIALCTVLSMVSSLTSIFGYAAAAALGLYALHHGLRPSLVVLAGAAAVTGLLAHLAFHQGPAVVVTSLLLWVPVWLAAVVLRGTGSLAMALLVLTVLAMLAVLGVYLFFGEPTPWWLERLKPLAELMSSQPGLGIDKSAATDFIEAAAPLMTGAMAAALNLAAASCVLLGRWWQSMLIKPGALKQEFHALRLTRSLSLLGIAIGALVPLKFGIVSSLALQWSLIVMVPFLFVGLAVLHASLANLQAAKGWLIGAYILMGLIPQFLLVMILVGALDPWLGIRQRTAKVGTS